MISKLNVDKAIQAAGVLLRHDGKQMTRLRLLKLLYIADRRSLKETGAPILGSSLVALKHGPLHSEVLDLINGEHVCEPLWSAYFLNEGRNIELQVEPPVGLLSRHEIETLHKVSDELVQLSDWDVADITHGFEEWLKNYPDPQENTSRPIPFEDVIDAVGRSDDKEAILQDLKDDEAFDRFFAK